MSKSRLEVAKLQNNFYRDNYRRVVFSFLLLLVINIGLLGAIFYFMTHRPKPQYFATSANGRIIPLYPLSSAMVGKGELLQWASKAAIAAYSYNFVSYQDNLKAASAYFTADGWQKFLSDLKASGNLQTVINNKLTSKAVPTGAPVILDQGIIQGRYAWKVQIPLLVEYEGESNQFSQSLTVTMIIERISNIDSASGVAIVQFSASQLGNSGQQAGAQAGT